MSCFVDNMMPKFSSKDKKWKQQTGWPLNIEHWKCARIVYVVISCVLFYSLPLMPSLALVSIRACSTCWGWVMSTCRSVRREEQTLRKCLAPSPSRFNTVANTSNPMASSRFAVALPNPESQPTEGRKKDGNMACYVPYSYCHHWWNVILLQLTHAYKVPQTTTANTTKGQLYNVFI